MNRKYTSSDIENIVNKIRENFKDAILTADIIVRLPRRDRGRICKNFRTFRENKII